MAFHVPGIIRGGRLHAAQRVSMVSHFGSAGGRAAQWDCCKHSAGCLPALSLLKGRWESAINILHSAGAAHGQHTAQRVIGGGLAASAQNLRPGLSTFLLGSIR